jgi:hypothetical protein
MFARDLTHILANETRFLARRSLRASGECASCGPWCAQAAGELDFLVERFE